MNNEDIKKLLATGTSHIIEYRKGKTIEKMEVTANFEQFESPARQEEEEYIVPAGVCPYTEENKSLGLISVWKMKTLTPDSFGWRRLAFNKIVSIDGQGI